MNKLEAIKAVNKILVKVTQRSPDYWLVDQYIRWGKIEKEICSVIMEET